MKKRDILLIIVILIIAVLSTGVLNLIENINSTGEAYGQITYAGEPILKINLNDPEIYDLYDSKYKDQVNVDRADEGIFYVPGETTTDMTELWKEDSYAKENQIVGIKLLVEDGKISVLYQESPRDLCQYEPPTNSSLKPIVCLPNKVVVKVITSQSSDEFYLDDVLE
ncbi:NusG domain II-containing protein [Mycoplasmatota bacterium]|nr:NusG domain II-containing protein [Mycoplasmatota bacterium]